MTTRADSLSDNLKECGELESAPNWFYATGSVCFLMGTLLNAWRAR